MIGLAKIQQFPFTSFSYEGGILHADGIEFMFTNNYLNSTVLYKNTKTGNLIALNISSFLSEKSETSNILSPSKNENEVVDDGQEDTVKKKNFKC